MSDPADALADAVKKHLLSVSSSGLESALREYEAENASREVYGYGVAKEGWRSMEIWPSRFCAEKDAAKWPGSKVVELFAVTEKP